MRWNTADPPGMGRARHAPLCSITGSGEDVVMGAYGHGLGMGKMLQWRLVPNIYHGWWWWCSIFQWMILTFLMETHPLKPLIDVFTTEKICFSVAKVDYQTGMYDNIWTYDAIWICHGAPNVVRCCKGVLYHPSGNHLQASRMLVEYVPFVTNLKIWQDVWLWRL